MSEEKIDHPDHYGGASAPHEAIKVIRAWHVGFWTGSALKYLARAGKKTEDPATDLRKAVWYLRDAPAHEGVTPLARRTVATTLMPSHVASAWALPPALAKALEAIYRGTPGKAVALIEEHIETL